MDATSKSAAVVPPIENPLSGVFVQICDIGTHGFGHSHSYGFHLGNLTKHRDEDPTCESVLAQIAELAQFRIVAKSGKVNRAIIAPKPEFGRTVLTAGMLTERINIDPTRGICLWRGRSADAFELMPGNVGAYASADCPTIILKTPSDRVFMIHAGLKCLVDTDSITTGCADKARETGSIIDVVASVIPEEERPGTEVVGMLGIAARNYAHPLQHERVEYRSWNERVVHYIYNEWGEGCFEGPFQEGLISLEALVRLQFAVYGITRIHFDTRDTYGDRSSHGGYRYYSERRGDSQRNLVLVWNVPW